MNVVVRVAPYAEIDAISMGWNAIFNTLALLSTNTPPVNQCASAESDKGGVWGHVVLQETASQVKGLKKIRLTRQ